jgi:hypothetical protein
MLASFAAAMSLPEMSLGGLAVVVLVACALFAFVWGMLRLLIGVAVVVVSIAAGVLTWNRAPAVAADYLDRTPDWLPGALALTAGLLTLLVLRRVLRFMRKPFGEPQGSSRSVLLSLLPAILLIALIFTAVRHFGAGSEVRYFRDAVASGKDAAPSLPFIVSLKEAAEKFLPQPVLASTELYNDRARVNLAKLATVMQDPAAVAALQFRAEARPLVTGENAASLRDPRIARLVAERRFADLLRDPVLVSLLENQEFRQSIESLDLETILAVHR